MSHALILIFQSLSLNSDSCNVVVHSFVGLVVGTAAAIVTALYFRGNQKWREELPEYLVGALLSGIVIGRLFCYVIDR